MIPVVTPKLIKLLFPQLVWDITTTEKIIYLTFDDGPEPSVTPKVLDLLHLYGLKATFFCLGQKAEQHPELISLIKKRGHSICNHGYTHISGFSAGKIAYLENCTKGSEITQSLQFRPPYGRITPWQLKAIRQHHKIIMWSIMSMDFSLKTTPLKCIKNVLSNIYPGAIIVFHDIPKAHKNIEEALPVIIKSLQDKGYKFEVL